MRLRQSQSINSSIKVCEDGLFVQCSMFMAFCEAFQTITGHAYVDTAKLVLCGPQCFLAFMPACCCAIAPHASDSAKD